MGKTIAGTLHYAAPEQRMLLSGCTRRKVDNRVQDFAAVLAGLAQMRQQPPEEPETGVTQQQPPVTTVSAGQKQGATFSVSSAGTSSAPLLYLKSKGIVAKGYEVAHGFLVLAGSQAVKETVPSFPAKPLSP